jgi:hypothetical protein
MGGGQNPAAPETDEQRKYQSCRSQTQHAVARVARGPDVTAAFPRRCLAAHRGSRSPGQIQRRHYLAALAALVLRPRLALATAAVLIVAGALLGVRDGNQMAHQDAQARYLAVVAPNSLR